MSLTEARVFIIDDDDGVRTSMARLLKTEGILSFGAPSADEGLELLRLVRRRSPHAPAVILLDLALPGMSAEDFRTAQLNDPMLANVPVIVASASTDAKRRADALGAIAVCHKPVDPERFGRLVRSIMTSQLVD